MPARGQRTDARDQPARKDYAPADHERFVDGLIRSFDRGLVRAARRRRLAEPRRPVFVFGLPRSGTTLIEQVLASHSQVHGAGELRLARRSFEAIPGVLGRSAAPRDCVSFLDRTAIVAAGGDHLERLAAIDGGRVQPHRRQDARQLHVYRPALDHVSPRHVHPLPPRPARHRRLVLDDRFPQHPLVERSGEHRRAVPPVPPRDEPLEEGLARSRFST